MMKLFIIVSLFLISAYSQQISFAGNWVVNETDFNCAQLCCCPQGTLQISQDPNNSSNVVVSPTSWSNNPICTQLDRSGSAEASYPFPANIDVTTTPLTSVYNDQNEGFAITFFNVTKYVVVKTIGAFLIIDDTSAGDMDGSMCQVTLVKKVI